MPYPDNGINGSVTTTNNDGSSGNLAQQILAGLNVNNQAGSTHSSSDVNSSISYGFTPKESAYSQLDQNMIKMFGRRASAAEKSAYYKQLHSAEKKYATKSSSKSGGKSTSDAQGNSRSTSRSKSKSTNFAFDSGSFMYEYMVGLAKNYLTQGKTFGGDAAQTFQQLSQYAADMGLSNDNNTMIHDTLNAVLGKGDVAKLQQDYRNRAMALYGGLTQRLQDNPTMTVRDVASDYINTMANMLDLDPRTIGISDNTLQKALTATKDNKPYVMTKNEFSNMIRQDNRFKYSTMAKDEAKGFAHSLASAMGFAG